MKIKLSYMSIAFFCFTLFAACSVSNQSASNQEVDVESLLQNQNFVFKAQSANPMRGSVVQLTSPYDVIVTKDTLRTFLPYFGRAYTAPTYNGEGGIRLTTTDFEYQLANKRKKRWNLLLKPNGDPNVREMTLSVSENGYANLRVMSNNRDPINFNGVVTARN